MTTRSKIILGVIAFVIIVLAAGGIAMYIAGRNAGFGAGALSGLLLAGGAAARKRMQDSIEVEDALTESDEATEELARIGDTDGLTEESADEASSMTGDEQADFINDLTGG